MKEEINYAYIYWLSSLNNISPEKRRIACESAGGAGRLYGMSARGLDGLHLFTEKETACIIKAQKECRPEEMWSEFQKNFGSAGMRFIPYDSPDYPERLKEIYNAPFALFVLGRLPDDDKKSVSVVGARSCSEYGRSVAQMLGRKLAEHGVQVISGMAIGIDSASHAGALSAGGDTFAVLGCGCDVCYPRSSRNIYDNILAGSGGIISELLPETQPQPYYFPMRNRIISALADIVVVVEARERSGSLITADLALEQGKDIYAVPGRYLDKLSVGCNRLIEQGAGIFTDMDSFLKNTGIAEDVRTDKITLAASAHSDGEKKGPQAASPLSDEAKKVYDCLDLSAKSLDEIIALSGMDLLTVLDALDTLKKNNIAQETFQNYFCKKI